MSELSEGSGYLVVPSRPITVVGPNITAKASADLETETPFPYGQRYYVVFVLSLYYTEKRRRMRGSLRQGPTVFLYGLCKFVGVPQFPYLI